MKNRRAGFTLIEMSIVLVIIGLLIGGIMFGRTLLIASRLKTVMTDLDSYTTAVGNFKQQYQALPGDMANATSLWGTDSVSCPSGGGTSGTCNGNGDGMIGLYGSGTEYEIFRFWQHLYYAGMFNTRLSGVATGGVVYNATIGVNTPAGSIAGSGFSVGWEGTVGSGSPILFPGTYGNIFAFGANVYQLATNGPILSADQAQSIDAKIDDGVPSTGNVRAPIAGSLVSPNCTTTAVASTAAYNLTNKNVVCSLIFISGF